MSQDADHAASKLPTSALTRRQCLRTLGGAVVGVAGCTAPAGSPTVPQTLIAAWRGRDPTQAVMLQWLTDDGDAAASVRLSAPDGSNVTTDTTVVSFGSSDLDRVRAELTGLKPDTEYAISIAERDTGDTVRTAPMTLTDSVVFAEGGDIGVSEDVPLLHEQAASWDPLFATVGGDLAYANGRDSHRWVTFLRDWHKHMRSGRRLIPMVTAIGNHEVQG